MKALNEVNYMFDSNIDERIKNICQQAENNYNIYLYNNQNKSQYKNKSESNKKNYLNKSNNSKKMIYSLIKQLQNLKKKKIFLIIFKIIILMIFKLKKKKNDF